MRLLGKRSQKSPADSKEYLFKLHGKTRDIYSRMLVWIYEHDTNPVVNVVASKLDLDGYNAIHYLNEDTRAIQRKVDSVASSLVNPEIILDKDSIIGGNCDLKTGTIRYNPAGWLAWAYNWRSHLSMPLGPVDESEFAFLVTNVTLQYTVVHEILHKFIHAQETAEVPRWFTDYISCTPPGPDGFNEMGRLRRDYEESWTWFFTDSLVGSWEGNIVLLLTELLATG